jgi:transposase InsO family protein
MTFSDYHAALEATKVAVYKYNNKRPHRSVDFMLPVDAHKESVPLKKHWEK